MCMYCHVMIASLFETKKITLQYPPLIQFLKAVFRLNNNAYILRSLRGSELLPVVCLADAECEDNYGQMILEQKRLYSHSWQRVIQVTTRKHQIHTKTEQYEKRRRSMLSSAHCSCSQLVAFFLNFFIYSLILFSLNVLHFLPCS